MTSSPSSVRFALLLPLFASIVALNPLAIDMYLPAFPQLVKSFETTASSIQWSLSLYLVGFSCGILLFGPLSDFLGRRRLALFGLVGFSTTSLASSFVTDIEVFNALRFLQAFLGSAATVVIPAIIRDLFEEKTAKGLSYVGLIMMIAPLIAPNIGSLLMQWFHWSSIFITLAIYAVVVFVLSLFFFPLSRKNKKTTLSFKQVFLNYKIVLSHKEARRYFLTIALSSLIFFGYLTQVSFIYIEHYGVSEQLFGILFAVNIISLMFANLINGQFVQAITPRKMIYFALSLGAIASILLTLVALINAPLIYFVGSLSVLIGCVGMINVNSDALILMLYKKEVGAASAVIGSLRFGCGSLAAPLLTLLTVLLTWGEIDSFQLNGPLPFAVLSLLSITAIIGIQFSAGRSLALKRSPISGG